MSKIVRTEMGSRLQTAMFSGLPLVIEQFTTLNEKFNILSGQLPPQGEYPVAKYLAIGNGGHDYSSGTGGIPLLTQKQHLSTDAALFSHLPFVLRATNNDIPSGTQANYALRTQITVGGQNYFAYYLKRLDTAQAQVQSMLQSINNGVVTTTSYIPTAANLTPVAPVIGGGVNVFESQYINVSASLPFVFTAQECQELLAAATILYGDPAYAVISEVALCSGYDRQITLPTSGAIFVDAVAVQVASFISTSHAIQFTATGIDGTLDIGVNEPLLSQQTQ